LRGKRITHSLAAAGACAFVALAGSDALAQDRAPGSSSGPRASLDDDWLDTTHAPVLRGREDPQGRAPRRRSPERPAFGSPPGSGAGDTGYISTNPTLPRASALRTALPAAAGNARLQAPTNGALRTTRPGSPPNGPSRAGASIEVPAGTTSRPIRRRPPEQDPFEPLGIRAGSFLLRPAIEVTGGYDSDPGRTKGGRGSSIITIAPELSVRSDWSRHALNADLRGTYTAYGAMPSLNRPYFDGRINGRIDISGQTRADIEARAVVSTESPNSPDLPADLARLPIYTTFGGSVGLAHRFNRFEVALKGSIDRTDYQNSVLTDGSVISNKDRNYNQYAGQLRLSYELTPGMKPFAEVQHDRRVRDLAVDAFGNRRDSWGTAGRVGTTFEFSGKLTGELSVGYLVRTYQDHTLPDLSGLIVDGSLVWTATALTSLRLTARSTADETTLPGVSGVLRRDVGAEVEHSFRRWLIGNARIGFGYDVYDGWVRRDQRYVAAAGITYKVTRSFQVKGELRQEWLRSNLPGNDYTATIALVGLRLQR